jgi:peptide/nickel transport system permease protein
VIRYLVGRFCWAVWLFFVATLITWVIFFLIPGDPFHFALDAERGGGFLQAVREQMHLDTPAYQQYWIFVWNIIRHQSLGYSFQNGASVRSIIAQDAGVTGSLVFGSLVFWILLSLPIGIVSALRPRSLFDRSAMVFVLVGIAAPPVWLGLILAYVFGFKLGWFPIADYCSIRSVGGECGGPLEWAYHMILPWATFTWLFAAIYVRMIRSSLLEVTGEDYVRTARAKGAPERRVVVQHILRNSLLPVVTMLGLDLAVAFGGVLFIEEVFNLHGLGVELLSAIHLSDVPVVMGVIIVLTLAVILMNFIVDVAYVVLDPRIRLR